MAQRSLPQAGSGVGDAGPYTSDEWAEYFQTLFTGDQEATQGPLIRFWNELEVTEAALVVTIDTGAGLVYGHFLINDVAVAINIALAAAGLSRWDRVVMVENNSNAVYNTNLTLPGAYAAGIPRNSARVAILRGVEGAPGLPRPLLTGPNFYMVELAQYQATDAAIGSVVDYRAFCEFSMKIPDGSVELIHMAADSVDSPQYVDGSIDTVHLANDSVDDTKAGARVPQFYRRQGGNAITWATTGTTNYIPTAVRMQGGAGMRTLVGGAAGIDSFFVTYPVAFSHSPLIYVSLGGQPDDEGVIISARPRAGLATTQMQVSLRHLTAVDDDYDYYWLAIGPE